MIEDILKIRVKDKEQSRAIQDRFFELGARWTEGKEYKKHEFPFLYVVYEEEYYRILTGSRPDLFDRDSSPEITFEELLELKSFEEFRLKENIESDILVETFFEHKDNLFILDTEGKIYLFDNDKKNFNSVKINK